MTPKFCGQCGTALKEDASFCPQCGWKVVSIEDSKSREFNPYNQNTNVQSTNFAQHNKDSGNKLVMIILISIGAILLGILIFIGVKSLSNKLQANNILKKDIKENSIVSNNNWEEPVENTAVENTEVEEESKQNSQVVSEQNSEIDGNWSIKATTDAVLVDGKVSADYISMIGQSSRTSIIFDTAQHIAILKEPYSGMDITLPLEYSGNGITIGSENDENAMIYKGNFSQEEGQFILEGEWENKNTEANMEMQGTFIAVKTKNLLSQDILDTAVSVSGEELKGIYRGILKYSSVENLEKVPEAMMSAEEKEMMKDFIGVDYECSAVVDGEEIDITFIHPEFGESSFDDLELAEMRDGVLSISEIEDEGIITMQLAVIGAQYDYSIIGAMEMRMKVPDEEDVVFLIEFDVYYYDMLEH